MAHPPITTSLTYLLAQANRLVSGALERLLAAEGAQIEHWRVLEVLSDEQGRSMGELAQLVLMNHPALTKLIDRMVSRGWVHRAADAADSRRVLVFATDAGVEFVARLRARVADYEESLDAGDRRAVQLKRLLGTLIREHG
ncbi:MAG TPA: MarR family transcriptional regulator [Burkholderiales bacterium]|nr:MarR family transcriptional regulator [Burkholderiales bacterium]